MTQREERYRAALEGIATCSTACECCAMHARVAESALLEPLAATCPHGYTVCKPCGFPYVENLPASGPN